ncbi:hypothetical protein J6590_102129 [Homalodisca vitripennis]|nr:hypothetical protein J6590_102129 [Homalodisca vitripennis]
MSRSGSSHFQLIVTGISAEQLHDRPVYTARAFVANRSDERSFVRGSGSVNSFGEPSKVESNARSCSSLIRPMSVFRRIIKGMLVRRSLSVNTSGFFEQRSPNSVLAYWLSSSHVSHFECGIPSLVYSV